MAANCGWVLLLTLWTLLAVGYAYSFADEAAVASSDGGGGDREGAAGGFTTRGGVPRRSRPPDKLRSVEEESDLLRQHRPPPDDVVVTVSLWDDGGALDMRREDEDVAVVGSSPPLHHHPKIPRYVIGKLAVVDGAGEAADDDGDAAKARTLKSSKKPMKGHYFTFDLGNSRQSILVAEGCRGCDCPSSAYAADRFHSNSSVVGMSRSSSSPVNSIADEKGRPPPPAVDCCPNTFPVGCGEGTGEDGDFCWPSHLDNFLPRESYRDVVDVDCPKNVSRATRVDGSNNSTTVCMQCFGCRSHSRFYTMAESDSLALVLGGDGSSPDEDASALVPLGEAFRFGALIGTTPNLDRLWSNIGLGYNSSFLTQMDVSSFLLHLRPGDHHRGAGGGRSSSHIILNPSPGRYLRRRGVRVVPFELDERRRRIHPVEMLVVGGGGGDDGGEGGVRRVRGGGGDGGGLTIPFHMDTGNPGIFLADGDVIDGLASATGGEWRVGEDWRDDEYHGFEDEASIGAEEGRCNVTTSTLFVPYGPAEAPTLDVVLYPDVVVSLPGDAWVISPGGGTIFSTYHKNVLGLPFLVRAGVDVVFDDVDRLLYVVKDDDEDVKVQSGLTADTR